MRIKVEIELRRPARRSMALVLVAILISVPAVALAGHQFSDVSHGHPFHVPISAIAGAGIAAGFGDGGYHPSDPVTRQAMAAFMHRGLGRVAMEVGSSTMNASLVANSGVNTTNYVPIRQLTMNVPGTTGEDTANQMVFVQGRVVFYSQFTSNQGCTCEFGAVIKNLTTGAESTRMYQMFDDEESAIRHYSFMVDGLFPASPGSHTFELNVFVENRTYIGVLGTFGLHSSTSLVATTFPFGRVGTHEL